MHVNESISLSLQLTIYVNQPEWPTSAKDITQLTIRWFDKCPFSRYLGGSASNFSALVLVL